MSNVKVPVHGPIRINNSKLLIESAISGQGIALCPRWLTETYINAGSLETLFDDYEVTASEFDTGVYLVYPYSKQVTSKLRVFIDFAKEHFKKYAWAKNI